jgi:hypothetical protein
MANHTLNLVQIGKPCEKDWDSMTGDGQSRFCSHCQKHVHNLSMISTDAAERLVCQGAGEICVRFARAPGGEMITLDYQARPKRNRWIWPVTMITAILTALAAALIGKSPKPVAVVGALPATRPSMMMGTIAPPMPMPPTTCPTAAANQPVSLSDTEGTIKP